jgi:GT2 family glycosyltransferase
MPRNELGDLRIGVVIVAFDSQAFIFENLNSLYKSALGARLQIDVIVVDNHPEKRDRNIVSFYPVRYVSLPKNPGFGSAINFAIQKFSCIESYSWLLLLNPDARIAENFFTEFVDLLNEDKIDPRLPVSPLILFEKQTETAQLGSIGLDGSSRKFAVEISSDLNPRFFNEYGRPKTGDNLGERDWVSVDFKELEIESFKIAYREISLVEPKDSKKQVVKVSPKSLKRRNLVNNVGSKIYGPWNCGDLAFGWLDVGYFEQVESDGVGWCGGAALLPTSYLTDVGLFDERFFLYYEDSDLALRGIKRGLPSQFRGSLRAYHIHSASIKTNSRTWRKNVVRSGALFSAKHFGIRMTFSHSLANFINDIRHRNYGAATRNFYFRVAGILASIRERPDKL